MSDYTITITTEQETNIQTLIDNQDMDIPCLFNTIKCNSINEYLQSIIDDKLINVLYISSKINDKILLDTIKNDPTLLDSINQAAINIKNPEIINSEKKQTP